MGIYRYTDPQTGRSYQFEHAGDAPTNEDFAFIQSHLQQERANYAEKYARVFGREFEAPDDGTAVGRGLARGTQQIKQAVGETLGTAGEQAGLGFLANYGQGVEERARQRLGELMLEQPERMQSTDVTGLGSALTYAGEVAGEQIPQLGLGIGAAVAAPVIAGATGFGAAALGVGAAALTTAPILFGNNIQRQEDEVAAGRKASVDVGDALVATFGQATLEGIADRMLLGVGKPLIGAGKAGWKGLFLRTASRAGTGGTTEALTEVGQQMMERAQAGLPIDSDDAIAEYREAAIAGGIVGGGTRATLGTFGEGRAEAAPTTPPAAPTTPPAAAPTAAPTQLELPLPEPAPRLQEGQEQGELFGEESYRRPPPATPPAAPTAAPEVTVGAVSEAAAAKEAENAAKSAATAQQKAAKKATQKTEEFMPEAAPQESGAAAIESEQTGQQIEVKGPDTASVTAPQTSVITKEMLDDLGISAQAPMRKKIIGKDLTDPDTQKQLRNYAKNSIVSARNPELKARIDALLGGVGAARTQPTGTGTGVPSGQPGVATGSGGRGVGGGTTDTERATAPDEGRLGASVPTPSIPATPTGQQPGAVEVIGVDQAIQNGVGEVTVLENGKEAPFKNFALSVDGDRAEVGMIQRDRAKTRAGIGYDAYVALGKQLADRGITLQSSELLQAPGRKLWERLTTEGNATYNPQTKRFEFTKAPEAELTPQAAERKRIRETPGAYAEMVRNALKQTGTRVPAEILVEPEEIAARQASLAQAAPASTSTPAGPMTGAVGGAETGTAGQVIPAPVSVPEVAPTTPVQGAPVPQAVLQAEEDARSAAAQARLDRSFESNRGKQAQRREFHDTQVDPRAAQDVTTALDKEAVADLVETADKDLDAQGKAAKLFFKRFRRPVDALAEMGAVSVVGPTQTVGKDYTPAEFAFYEGMTQNSANAARRWVFANMSRQASTAVREARNIAKRDTAKFNPSDAYIAVTKVMKGIIRKEDAALRKQMDRELEAMAAQKRPPTAPDQEMRGEGPVGTVTPVKGLTKFDAYLTGLGFKRRKLPKQDDYVWFDPQNDNRVLTDEELMGYYDDLVYTQNQLGFFLVDPVHGLDMALLPSVKNALARGDLQFALDAIAATNGVKRVRQVAARLGKVVGATKVQVVDDLSSMVGRKAAGMYDPETNTIYIDANEGMNVHTVLHELTHAATSAAIANPSLPETKQLQTLLNAAREQMGEVYGTGSLDEFVAEAFSNPEFQMALSLMKVDGGKLSAWDKFANAVRRIVRKIMGLEPKSPDSILDEVDRIITGMLTPAPDTRAAPSMMLLAGTRQGAAQLLQSAANLAPETSGKIADYADIIYNEGAAPKVRGFVLDTLPVNILTDIASSRIPFARELNMLINKQSGALRNKSEMLDSMLGDMHTWQRKNPKLSKILNNIIPRSTYLKVDPSRTDAEYMRNIRKDRERSAEYDELRKEFLKLDKKGQDLYKQTRNYFQDTYDDIIAALDARLDAAIPDAEVKRNAFEKLRQLLQKDTGVIRPYFPLMRKGQYRLAYQAPDPDTGRPELFVEYYPTLRKAQQAKDMVANLDPNAEISDASSTMDFRKAPNTGFVRDILNTLQFNQDKFDSDANYRKVMQEIVDLSLDAMPERSFMQNFRRRKGVRGFIGDTTPTGMGGMEFDAYTMLKEKGRDLNKQLVQLKSAAELEKFRAKLKDGGYMANPETAMISRKLDQMANFAQSPNVPRWSQVANSLGFGFTMGLNFSSAAITFFDVAMSAMPVLSGEYGVGNTTRAYGSATRALANAPTKRTVMVPGPDGRPVPQEVNMGWAGKTIANHDLNNLPPELNNIRADILITMGLDQGQFNQSITQESLEVGRDAPLEKLNKYSSFMFHHAERYNRETTLLAAYALEVQKLSNNGRQRLTEQQYKDAAQKAINSTEFTLGATAAAGRPIVAQSGIGNILFLFKRFAISKYYMMYKLGKEALGGDPIARAALRNFMVSTGLFAGLGGMPMMGGIGAIYNMLRDDDEDDFEAATRKFVGEGIYGGLANEVLGIDLANRISMNSLLYRAPIVEKDQSALWTLAEQLGGPVIGVSLSAERGVKGLADGEIWRGIEAMAPAAVRNGLKAFRFATEGATTRRGDPVVEDINPYNVIMQGLGFAPAAYIEQLEFNKNNRRRQEAINSRRTKLLRQRNVALREGDREAVREIDAKIAEFNAGLPEGAEKSRITPDTISRSFKSFGQTTDKMRGGLTYTPFMEKSLKEFDQGMQFF